MEDRMSPPAPPARSNLFWRRRKVLIILSLIALFGLFAAYYFTRKASPAPISTAIRESVTYRLFYPDTSEVTPGYRYKPGSLKLQGGIVFYTFTEGAKEITVSEQPSPGPHIGLESLVGFTAFSTPNGTAYVGKQKTGPTALLNTPETLITISSGLDVPDDVVNSLVKSLRKVD